MPDRIPLLKFKPPSSRLKPVEIIFEEGFEMLGQSLMIFGLMSRLKLRSG